MNKITALTFIECYLPGFRFGGPVRTISNMAEHLSADVDFKIVTRDRDLGEKEPYPGIIPGRWYPVGSAQVYYATRRQLWLHNLRKLLNSEEYDVIYLNSFFSPDFSIKIMFLRRLGLIPYKPVILAPRGEFSDGALSLKRLKKHIYLVAARKLGIYKQHILWQASSEYEESDIKRIIGKSANVNIAITIAPDLPQAPGLENNNTTSEVIEPDHLKIIFLSRISRMKNLDYSIRVLYDIPFPVTFDIYGPIGDQEYWNECKQLLHKLPSHIQYEYKGIVEPGDVHSVMHKYDLLFLPTRGENFGHVIFEAFRAGCPVLISNKTLWRDLTAKNVGWDLPLEDVERFRAALKEYTGMDCAQRTEMRHRAKEFADSFVRNSNILQQNRELFVKSLRVP